jgi:hypothetical protein
LEFAKLCDTVSISRWQGAGWDQVRSNYRIAVPDGWLSMIIGFVKQSSEGFCQGNTAPWVDAYNQTSTDFRNNSQKVESQAQAHSAMLIADQKLQTALKCNQ